MSLHWTLIKNHIFLKRTIVKHRWELTEMKPGIALDCSSSGCTLVHWPFMALGRGTINPPLGLLKLRIMQLNLRFKTAIKSEGSDTLLRTADAEWFYRSTNRMVILEWIIRKCVFESTVWAKMIYQDALIHGRCEWVTDNITKTILTILITWPRNYCEEEWKYFCIY